MHYKAEDACYNTMEADFNHSSTLKVKTLLIIHFSWADITEQLCYTHTHTHTHTDTSCKTKGIENCQEVKLVFLETHYTSMK